MDDEAVDAAIQDILEEGPMLLRTARYARRVSMFWRQLADDGVETDDATELTHHYMDQVATEAWWDDEDENADDE